MQGRSSTTPTTFTRKVTISVLSILTLISGAHFASASLLDAKVPFGESRPFTSLVVAIRSNAFSLNTITKNFFEVAVNLPQQVSQVNSFSRRALGSIPTDLASNTSYTVPQVAFGFPPVLPLASLVGELFASLSIPEMLEMKVTLSGTENRIIASVGTNISLIGDVEVSDFIPEALTSTRVIHDQQVAIGVDESLLTSSSVALFDDTYSLASVIKVPRIAEATNLPLLAVASVPSMEASEGVVLGVSTTATNASSKKSLPLLDRLSLSLYCKLAKDSTTDVRCNYDAVALGLVPSFTGSVPVSTSTPVGTISVATTSLGLISQAFEPKSSSGPIYITKYVTEYVPVVGPAGRDGRDGKNGADGVTAVNNIQAPLGIGSYIIPSISSPAGSIGISTISYLKDTTIDNPTINRGTATDFSLFSPTLRNAVFNGLSLFNDTVDMSGATLISNLTATSSVLLNSTLTNSTTTNAYVTNLTAASSTFADATTTNAFISNLFVTSATSTDSYITRLVAASSTLTDAMLTNSTTTNAYITSLVAASSTLLDLIATNASTTNATTTNSYIRNFFADTGTTTNLFVQTLSVGSSTSNMMTITGNLAVQGTTTLATTTATDFVASRATTTSLFSDLLTALTGLFTDLRATNATTTNLFVQNLAVGNASTTGNQSIEGTFNVTGTTTMQSNTALNGSVVIGTSSSNMLTVNALVNSNFAPAQNNSYDLGSPSFYWRTLYADSINVNSISAASTTISGTSNSSFTINSDNDTVDTEDMSLVFFRGLVNPNAVLSWNSSAKRFVANQSFLVTNETPSVGSTTFTIQGGQGQGTKNLFELLTNSGTTTTVFNANGWLGIGSTTPGYKLAVVGDGYFGGNLTATGTIMTSGVVQSASGIFRGDDQYHQIIFHNGGNSTDYIEWGDTLTNNGGHRFYTGGASPTLRLQIADNGTYMEGPVGIGSTTPGYKLAVVGDGYFGGNLTATGTLNISGQTTLTTASSTGLTVTGATFLATGSGNVGIGTTTPGTKLSVVGGASISQDLFIRGGSALLGNSVTGINIRNNSSNKPVLELHTRSDSISSDQDLEGINWYAGLTTPINTARVGIVNVGSGENAASLYFSTASSGTLTEQMRITNTGNVGIGSTTPGYKLSVVGDGYFGGNLTATGTLSAGASSFTTLTTTGTSTFATGGGNVGIGTTTPSFKLDILQSSNGVGGRIAYPSGTAALHFLSNPASSADIYFGDTSNATIGSLRYFHSDDSMRFYTNGTTERVRIDSSGNLGIGSTTPGYKLSVVGDGYFGGNLTATGTLNITGQTTLDNASTTNLSVSGTLYAPTVSGTTGSFTTLTSTGTSTFATGGGFVGIGTTTPTDVLDIVTGKDLTANGRITAGSLTVSSGPTLATVPTLTFSSTMTVGAAASWNGNTRFTYDSNGFVISHNGAGGPGSAPHGFGLGTAGRNGDLFIDSSGNVGVGTTSSSLSIPLVAKFNVIGNSYFAGNITATGTLSIDGQTTLTTASSTGLTVTGDTFLATVSGNVGIGSTTPGYKLSVVGDGYFGGNLTATGTLAVSGTTTASRVLADDGSASLPAFAFSGSPTTGIYRSGNTVNTSVAGTSRFTVTTAGAGVASTGVFGFSVNANPSIGDLGISRASSGVLAVGNGTQGDFSATLLAGNLAVGTSTVGANLFVQGSGSNPSFTVATSTGATQFTVLADGKVGIGTTTPVSTLQLGDYTLASTATPVDISLGGTQSNVAGASSRAKLRLWTTGTAVMGFGVSSNQMEYITSNSAYDHVWYGGGSELMRLDGATGNFSIGTTSPGLNKLHVASTGSAGITLEDLDAGEQAQLVQGGSVFSIVSDPNNTVGNSAIDFKIDGTSSTESKMRLTTTGLGIGTTTPQASLHVLGGTIIQSNVTPNSLSVTTAANLGNPQLSVINRGANGSMAGIHVYSGGINSGTFLTSDGVSTGRWSAGAAFHGSSLWRATETVGSALVQQDGALIYSASTSQSIGSTGSMNELFRITSTGNVGIGSSTPTTLLSVQGNTTSPLATLYNSNASGSGLIINAGNASVGTQSLLDVQAGGTSRFIVREDGNIGIGTSTPASQLTIQSTVSSAANSSQISLIGGSGNVLSDDILGGIDFLSNDLGLATTTAKIQAIASGSHTTSLFDTDLAFFTAAGTTLAERMRINKSGNIGIGSTTPGYKLAVVGDGYFGGNLTATGTLNVTGLASLTTLTTTGTSTLATGGGFVGVGVASTPWSKFEVYDSFNNSAVLPQDYDGGLTVTNPSTTTGTYSLLKMLSYGAGDNGDGSYIKSQNRGNNNIDLTFGNFINNGTHTDIMTLYSSGNVGIGSTTPGYKLAVVGNGYFGGNLTATGTLSAVSGIFTNASTTNLSIAGALHDSIGSAGSLGQVLLNTGTSTLWVATSSLGIIGGNISYGSSTSVGAAGAIQFASSTAGFFDAASAFSWDNVNGRLGVGTSAPTSVLSVASSTASGTSRLFNIATAADLFAVLANGNVGIGTSTPGSLLSIASSTASGSALNPLLTVGTTTNLGFNVFSNGQSSFYTATPASNTTLTVNGTTTSTTGIAVGIITTGTAFNASAITSGNALSSATLNSGTGLNLTAISSGQGVNIGTTCTTCVGMTFGVGAAAMTTASAIRWTGSANITGDYTGSFIQVNPTRNGGAAATRTFSGSMLNISPSFTTSGAVNAIHNITGTTTNITRTISAGATGATASLTATGPIVAIGNIKGAGTGTTTDSSTLLDIYQYNTTGTGNLISATNLGTGNLATFTGNGNFGIGTTTPLSRLSVVGLSGSSQSVFNVATSTGDSLFTVLSTGRVGVGTTSPSAMLGVTGDAYIGGNFTATGTLSISGTSAFTGNVSIGTSTAASRLDLWNSTSSSDVDLFRIGTDVGSANNVVFRVDSDGDIFSDGAAVIGTPADIAESYTAMEVVDAGTIVAFATSTGVSWSATKGSATTTASSTDIYEISGVRKAHNGFEAVGIVSTRPGLHLGADIVNGVPVALSGRVPVKVTTENGEVKAGDYLTVSLSRPGYAMRLTGEGKAIGRAISSYTVGNDKVMAFIENGYQKVDMDGKHATTTGMLTTSNVDLNANAVAIYNIKSLASANGTWSIDEQGRIIAKVLCLEDVCIDKTQLTNILNSTGQTGIVAGTSTSTNSGGLSPDTGTTTPPTGDTGTSTPSGGSGDEAPSGSTPPTPEASVETPESAPSGESQTPEIPEVIPVPAPTDPTPVADDGASTPVSQGNETAEPSS